MRQQSLALVSVLLAAFMGALDAFVVIIALPTIKADLGATAAEVQMIIVAYVVPYAGLLIVGGRTGDRYGYRRVFLIALTGFTVASVGCSLAPSAPALILARAVQGVAAGFMLPQVLALIRSVFEDASARQRAMNSYSAVHGLAAVSGHMVGGMLIAFAPADWSWRTIFVVNVPLAALSLILGARVLPRLMSSLGHVIDWLSALLQIVAVAAFLGVAMLGAGQDATSTGTPWLVSLLFVGVVSGAAFARRQKLLVRRGLEPLMPPRLLLDPAFRAGLIAVLSYFLSAGIQVILVYHLQSAAGLAPIKVALVYLPFFAAFSIVSFRAASVLKRLGQDAVWQAMVISVLPIAALGAVLLLLPERQLPAAIAAILLVKGCLDGVVMGPMFGVVLSRVAVADAGVGSGILLTGLQFAYAGGVALVGGVFFWLLRLWPSTPQIAAAASILLFIPGVLTAAGLLKTLSSPKPKRAPAPFSPDDRPVPRDPATGIPKNGEYTAHGRGAVVQDTEP